MSEQPETQQPESPKPEAPKTDRVGLPTDTITFDDFAKIKLRVGRVLEASEHPNADKLLVLKVDLGDEQRQIVAGLKAYYEPESLVGKNLIIVANLAPRKMRFGVSEGMVLASGPGGKDIYILRPDSGAQPGMRVH